MIQLTYTIEFERATTPGEARRQMDAFREAVLPSHTYGLTIYEAEPTTPADGIRRKRGVEVGCENPQCDDCYEPTP